MSEVRTVTMLEVLKLGFNTTRHYGTLYQLASLPSFKKTYHSEGVTYF
jgi:hypothetical protein